MGLKSPWSFPLFLSMQSCMGRRIVTISGAQGSDKALLHFVTPLSSTAEGGFALLKLLNWMSIYFLEVPVLGFRHQDSDSRTILAYRTVQRILINGHGATRGAAVIRQLHSKNCMEIATVQIRCLLKIRTLALIIVGVEAITLALIQLTNAA